MPVVAWWGISAIAAGIGAAIPILSLGHTAEQTGNAAKTAAPVIIAGIALGAYLLLRKG